MSDYPILEKLTSKKGFSIESYCFPEQIAFIRDPSKEKTAVCSRRAGKTVADAAYLIDNAEKRPGTIGLYITLSRNNAKKLIWPELLKINTKYKLKGRIDSTELSITFPNKSVIYCSGAKDATEIEKFRGLPLSLCIIDEGQSFRAYIKVLIDDIIAKALYDYDGTIAATGTPGPVPSGYFYDISHSPIWSHHVWTMHKNPWLQKKSGKTVDQLIQQDLRRMGVTIDDPRIRRECFAEWSVDLNSLVFRYNSTLNDYRDLPNDVSTWNYVIGIDIGFEDADAYAVIGWQENRSKSYLIEEIIKNKQGITDLANTADKLIKKYDPIATVIDEGGLGKKIAEEMRSRYALPIIAAEKSRKFEFIELLNDAMRTGNFMAKKESRFAEDCGMVEWDIDKMRPDKKVISDRYHTDIGEAVLYAFREALHWLAEPAKPARPAKGSREHFQERENELESRIDHAYKKSKGEDLDPLESNFFNQDWKEFQ